MDKNKLLLPVSILLSAIIIAGAVLYKGGSLNTTTKLQGSSENNGNLDRALFLRLASKAKMNVSDFTQCLDSGKHSAVILSDSQSAAAVGVQGTPTVFINGTKLSGVDPSNPVGQYKAAIDAALAGNSPHLSATTTAYLALNNRDIILGDPNAKVTLIEYADYQCPFCSRFFTQVEPQIKKDYIDTGKVKMIYRNFAFLDTDQTGQPTGYKESHLSAEAAECAKDQNKFWQYHDLLFQAEAADEARYQ